ncbi:MAG: CsbD family protein [Chloroflexi bacterium]|nr:CsbD family protein [Chloroflexota bacterium]MBP8058506.1 CsbD family protein [Chloroflexota bacterium]
MNEFILKGQWKQLKGEIRKQWGKLTDDELDQINGEYEKLVGRIQERYGRTREEAQTEIEEYLASHPTTTF